MEVARALEEKQRLIAEILNVPLVEFEAAAALATASERPLAAADADSAAASGGGGGGSSSSSSTLHPAVATAALADKDAREVLLAALAQGTLIPQEILTTPSFWLTYTFQMLNQIHIIRV